MVLVYGLMSCCQGQLYDTVYPVLRAEPYLSIPTTESKSWNTHVTVNECSSDWQETVKADA